MIIKTEDFQAAAKTILLAVGVDRNAANVEILAKDNILALNVTNTEYYVRVNFETETTEDFRVVVDAALFLDLVSGITTETFELNVTENGLEIKTGKSKYKIAKSAELTSLPVIKLENKTVEMNISEGILKSILNVNGKEILKAKAIDVTELRKLYYITDSGCFTFVTGACVNKFTLEKPIKMLLNDRIVKLFKLFKTDVYFSYGYDLEPDGKMSTKVTFETENIYVAAKINCDDQLLSNMEKYYAAAVGLGEQTYATHVVVSVNALSSAISRLMRFAKNSDSNTNMATIPATVKFEGDSMSIIDSAGNEESVVFENGSYITEAYPMSINIVDLKLVLDGCTDAHISLSSGNHKSVLISYGTSYSLIPERSEK